MRALQESTDELQARLDSALAEKAVMHRQWLALRRQLAECTAQNHRLEAGALPICKQVWFTRGNRHGDTHGDAHLIPVPILLPLLS